MTSFTHFHNIFYRVMPKKFRLSVPVKNSWRKAQGRTVSVEHISTSLKTTDDELKVSIPIQLVCECEATTLSSLWGRVKELSALPHGMYWCIRYDKYIILMRPGWVDTSVDPAELLVLTKLEVVDGTPQVM